MGNPRQTIPNLPPAIGLAGPEQIWINQAGVDRRTSLQAIADLAPPTTSGGVAVGDYATMRATPFAANVTAITLNDPYKGGVFVRSPTQHRDDGGLYIKDASGQTWVRTGWERVNVAWYYNCPPVTTGTLTAVKDGFEPFTVIDNADGASILGAQLSLQAPPVDVVAAPASTTTVHFFGDGSGVTITSADQAANPQWMGLPNYTPPGNNVPLGPYPVGTTWDYVALQEALYACFASRSTAGNIIWSNTANGTLQSDNLPMWVPKGRITTNQGLYAEMSGVDIYFAEKAGCNITYTGAPGAQPAVMFNAINYGSIHNLSVSAPYGASPVVSLDYTGPQGSHGLALQQLTFYDWLVGGDTVHDQIGVAIAYQGGATAQGDTITFVTPTILSCGYVGLYAGGFNALSIVVLGGNIQGCMRYGVYGTVGSFEIYGTSFQAQAAWYYRGHPQRHQTNYYGADVHYSGDGGATTTRAMCDVRSEGNVLYLCDSYVGGSIRNCQTAGADWYAPGWGTGIVETQGYTIGADTATQLNRDLVLVDDGGPQWFNSGPGSTTTVIQAPGAAWTTNQWAGRYAWVWWRNTYIQAVTITANDASSLTVTGWPAGLPPVGTPIKITGTGGTTQPTWDSFPQGLYANGALASGYGVTTTAGSNVITTGSGGMSVGWYVMIPNALKFTDGNGTYPVTGPLIGQIGSITGGSITLVDALGAPINASVSLHDVAGYFGPAIPDGQLTWMPLNWDAICAPGGQIDHCFFARGHGSKIGDATFFGGGMPFTSAFFRQGDGVANRLDYKNSGDQGVAPPMDFMNGAYTFTLGQLAQARSYGFFVSGGTTVNLPTLGGGMEGRLRLYLQANATSPVITWGTNIKAVAPTLTLGTAGKMTVVDLAWTANHGFQGSYAGSWFVVGIQGPM